LDVKLALLVEMNDNRTKLSGVQEECPRACPRALLLGGGVADRSRPGSTRPYRSRVATLACYHPEQSQGLL